MKFKIDENLPVEVAEVFQDSGYDATTIIDQNLSGSKEPDIASVCQKENRALVTLDLDFSDIRTYPPSDFPGLVILRLKRQEKQHVLSVVKDLIKAFSFEPLEQYLWMLKRDVLELEISLDSEWRNQISKCIPFHFL